MEMELKYGSGEVDKTPQEKTPWLNNFGCQGEKPDQGQQLSLFVHAFLSYQEEVRRRM